MKKSYPRNLILFLAAIVVIASFFFFFYPLISELTRPKADPQVDIKIDEKFLKKLDELKDNSIDLESN